MAHTPVPNPATMTGGTREIVTVADAVMVRAERSAAVMTVPARAAAAMLLRDPH